MKYVYLCWSQFGTNRGMDLVCIYGKLDSAMTWIENIAKKEGKEVQFVDDLGWYVDGLTYGFRVEKRQVDE